MDIALKLVDGSIDIAIEDDDIAPDKNGIDTSTLLSLFLDARVSAEELPDGEESRRGFWGDELGDGPATGSKLWLLKREKTSNSTRLSAEQYAEESLSHLASDGFTSELAAEGSVDNGKLFILISGKKFQIG